MGRRVFFSFDYDDAMLCAQIQNCHVVGWDGPSFTNASEWESVRRNRPDVIKRWIDDQLDGTSVTLVVIGMHTHESGWVRYEIAESVRRRKGLLGIQTHNMNAPRSASSATFGFGLYRRPYPNPFERVDARTYGPNASRGLLAMPRTLAEQVRTYDWVNDEGRENVARWIEEAYSDAQRG